MKRLTIVLMICLATCINSGCTSKEELLPAGEHTVKSVYMAHSSGDANGIRRVVPMRPLNDAERESDPYLFHNTPRPAYTMLPNPTLFMYVRDRLTPDQRVPIPAYITEFKMFERDEYAIHGESGVYSQ